jgi:hypothetical protein
VLFGTWDDRQSVALIEAGGIANVRLTLKREIFVTGAKPVARLYFLFPRYFLFPWGGGF